MRVHRLLLTLLTVNILLTLRKQSARSNQSITYSKIIKVRNPHTLNKIPISRSINLEDPNRISIIKVLINKIIIQSQRSIRNINPMTILNLSQTILNNRNHLQTQNINLNKANRLSILHIKSSNNRTLIITTILTTLHRTHLIQWHRRHHHTSSMHTRSTNTILQLTSNRNNIRILRIKNTTLSRRLQLIQSLKKRRNIINLLIRHLIHTRNILNNTLSLKRTINRNRGNIILTPTIPQILLHLITTLILKVQVNIRIIITLRIQKTRKQQTILNRINLRNIQQKGQQTTTNTTTTRTTPNIIIISPFNQIPNHQKIIRKTKPSNNTQLLIQPNPILLRQPTPTKFKRSNLTQIIIRIQSPQILRQQLPLNSNLRSTFLCHLHRVF